MKVEVHGHAVLADSMGAAGEYGPEWLEGPSGEAVLRVGPYRGTLAPSYQDFIKSDIVAQISDPARRVEWLDQRGIDKMIVTISPLWYLYWAPVDIGVPFASLNNDLLAKYCASNSDRLHFAATLPMQDVAASVAEVSRAAALGAVAVNIGTSDFGGRNFDDQSLWPIYEDLVKRDLPILIHPYPAPVHDGGEDRYNLSWVLGYVYEESVAFAHLTLGGVLDEFPDLRIYITHGGGVVPYQFGRIEAARLTNQPGVRAQRPLREYLERNFIFDVHVHDLKARRFLVDFMGADRLVVGSNVGGWDAAECFEMLDELELPPADYAKIAGDNAVAFFNL